MVDKRDVVYLAGAFDVGGSISVSIGKREVRRIGYSFTPRIMLALTSKNKRIFGLLDEYCEENQIQYRIQEHGDQTRFILKGIDDIEKFLEPLIPYLIQKYEQSILMIEEILPGVREEKHLNREGFLELMDAVEEIREYDAGERSSKYTKKYFEKEWSDELAQ